MADKILEKSDQSWGAKTAPPPPQLRGGSCGPAKPHTTVLQIDIYIVTGITASQLA
jgi:hypothetical protein